MILDDATHPTVHPSDASPVGATMPETMPPKPDRTDTEEIRELAADVLARSSMPATARDLATLAVALCNEVDATRERHAATGRPLREPRTPDGRLVARAMAHLGVDKSTLAADLDVHPSILSRCNATGANYKGLPARVWATLLQILGDDALEEDLVDRSKNSY